MFIVHGSWFRRNIRWLLAVILALLIPSFIALYTNVDTSRRTDVPLPTVDGKPVNPAVFQQARTTVIDEALLRSGGQLPRTSEFAEYIQQQTLLRMLMLEEAERLGIQVDDDTLVAHIRRQPFLLNQQGRFDPNRYREFIVGLNANRITETRFENLMRQQVIMEQLRNLVSTTAKVTPLQVKDTFRALNESVVVDYAVFTFDDDGSGIEVTADELEGYYQLNQERYRTSRRSKVRYTFVPLDPAGQTVTEQDITTFYENSSNRFPTNTLDEVKEEIRAELTRSRALYAAGDRATELTVKLVPDSDAPTTDFAAIATAAGLAVTETDYFAAGDEIPGIAAETAPVFIRSALSLSAASRVSDPVETENGFYVIELLDSQPSEIPALDTIRDRVTADLRKERAVQQAAARARAIAEDIRAAVGAGQTFAAAAQAAGLEPATSKAFQLGGASPDLPGAGQVRERALGMRLGQVSDFIRTADGGVVFAVKERTQPTDQQFEVERARTVQLLERQQQDAVWQAWVRDLLQRRQVNL